MENQFGLEKKEKSRLTLPENQISRPGLVFLGQAVVMV
jgi:hypothetical protein